MQDKNFFRMMGVLQLLIAFINFYVAITVLGDLSVFTASLAALCTMGGVFCTVVGAKLLGAID